MIKQFRNIVTNDVFMVASLESQSLVTGVQTLLQLDDATVEGLPLVGADYKITPTITGRYLVMAAIEWAASATGIREVSLGNTGGTMLYGGNTCPGGVAGRAMQQNMIDVVTLAAGTKYGLFAYHSAAANLVVNYVNFYIQLLNTMHN